MQISKQVNMKNEIPLHISPAGEADFTELHSLAAICFDKEWTWLNTLGMLTLPGIIRFKAIDLQSGKIIGFIASEPPNTEAVAWILAIGVSPDFRRMGIAQRLLGVCEVASNALRLRLCVRQSNEPAQRLYQHVGYQCVGIWENYYLNENAFVFEKKSVS